MSEAALRRNVMKWIAPLDPHPCENRAAGPGTPDLNYADGWLELKQLPEWPKRESTVARVDHFTKQQRDFLGGRWAVGGEAYLLLRVGREHLIFDGQVAHDSVGLVTRESLYNRARWVKRPHDDQPPAGQMLLDFLSRGR